MDAATPSGQRPTIPTGSRAIWCGKYDANWVVPVGYPNLTNQILYIDLESNRVPILASTGTYSVSMKMNLSLEQNYDYAYFIGGGDDDANNFGDEDPLGNDRGGFDQVRATGSFASSTLQATLTGSITATNPVSGTVNGAGNPTIIGEGGSGPATRTITYVTTTDNRALYILITADCLFSSEDGLWPFGNGVILDDITVTDTANPTARVIYDEQTLAGGTDAVGGDILVADPITATETDGVRISARVFPGKGELWAIQQGNDYATGADICASKSLASDRFFLGVDPVTKNALPGQFNSIVSCTFPVPAGTADITALWGEYMNLPHTSGYVQYAEYRYYKDGSWSNWQNTSAGGGVHALVIDQWIVDGDPLAAAVQADSVQIRWNIQCVPALAADRTNCDNNTQYAVLYDDLFLQITTGVPAPVFGIFPSSVAQSTFVDGTMTGLNCTTTPCWPGIRGSDLQTNPNIDIARSAVRDNLNSPLGDSITVAVASGLRRNGMGINWRYGYDKSVNAGLTIAHTNASYNPAFDTPRMIYRLFDPATKTWSPLDSTELDADAVSVSGPDTVVIGSAFRVDWPPRDKVGLNLPGGFTINGQGAYSSLAFLPRGCRMQYTFKGVDINGGVSYPSANIGVPEEIEPIVPGQPIGWWWWLWCVLPGAYPPGSPGSLLAGRTDTPILNLDGAYSAWSHGYDPVTGGLRGMGVRADRYRHLQGYAQGANIGGHELTGDRPARLSNYFPNLEEYGIVDSLRSWYRIIIQSSHLRTPTVFDEQDAQLVSNWAATPGSDGDRCIFFSGDDAFNALTNTPAGVPSARKLALSSAIFGVANVTTAAPSAAKGSWAGTVSNAFPTIDDRFAAQASGPGLAASASFTYEVDGGCSGPNRFDPLTATGGAFASATFPVAAGVTDVASVAKASEFDTIADLDQIKSLGYGFSIQYVRGAPGAIPRTAANYARSGVQNRMQILYKFLTGCRGARGSGSLCWPCPTDATMMSDWAAATGFNTALYGPLMPIQDFTMATGIEVEESSAAPRVNALGQNRPNPFNPETTIPFSTAAAGRVSIRVFDVAGRLVRTLMDRVMPSGDYVARWNGETNRGARAASGIYFYRIIYPSGDVSSRKMTILR